MTALLIAPDPYTDESLIGYIARLTALNGYTKTSWIYEKSGLMTSNRHIINLNKMSPSTSLYLLGLLTENSQDILWMGTFHNNLLSDENISKEISETIRNGAFTYRNKKCCPLCLKEKNYFRKLWELTIYNVCHKHNCLLIKKCPNCENEINLSTVPLGKCKCGHYYKDSAISTVSDDNYRLEKMLVAMFDKDYMDDSDNRLASLDIRLIVYELILFTRFSRAIECGPEGSSHKFSYRNSKAAYEVFENWPNSFYDFLDLYNDTKRSSSRGQVRLQREFGELYSHLNNIKNVNNSLSFIALEFENYLIDRWNGPLHNVLRMKDKSDNNNNKWLSVLEMANMMGCREERILRLIKNNVIEYKLFKSTKRYYLISRESAISYQDRIKDEITRSVGYKILNINDRMFNDFVDSGIIRESNLTLRKGQTKVNKSSVENLLEKLKNVTISDQFNNGNLVSFPSAIRIFGIAKQTPSKFIQLVLDGKIVPVLKEPYKSQKGLRNFYFIDKQLRESL
jgi:hypothetical protein